MTIKSNRSRLLLWALALGIPSWAGCGMLSKNGKQGSDPLNTGATTAEVSPRQVADVHIALGQSLEEQGDDEKASTAFRDALKKDPRRSDALVKLAILNDRRGKHKEADDLFRRALEIAGDNPEILCDRGYSLYLQRRWAEAEGSLRQALALKPDSARAHNNLGLVLAREGKAEAALAEFVRAGSDTPDAHSNLALILGEEGHWLEARKHYGIALGAKPTSEAAKEGIKATTAILAKVDPKPRAASDPKIARAGVPGPPAKGVRRAE